MVTPLASVIVVVVTYNRKFLLLECLQAIQAQTYSVSKVVVVDNASTDGTEEFILQNSFSFPIHWVSMSSNQGGAGGFSEGVKTALEGESCDWLWLMDDDAEPSRDCLESLLHTPQIDRYGFIAPRIIHHQTSKDESYHHKIKIDSFRIRECQRSLEDSGSCELEANAFVGVLISREGALRVGLPDSSYFIWFDDTDYTYRISQKYKIGFLNYESIIYHKDQVVVVNQDNWKHLYGLRNRIRFYKKITKFYGKFVLFLKTLKHSVNYLLRRDPGSARVLWLEFWVGEQLINQNLEGRSFKKVQYIYFNGKRSELLTI